MMLLMVQTFQSVVPVMEHALKDLAKIAISTSTTNTLYVLQSLSFIHNYTQSTVIHNIIDCLACDEFERN